MLAKAKPEELPVVEALVLVALAHDRELLGLLRRYRNQPTRLHAPGATPVDHELDRGLSALEMLLSAQAPLYGADSEQAQAAGRVRQAAFPLGVAAVTSLPFVEEHATVTDLLAELQEPESSLAADIAVLGLAPTFERMATLNARYGELLSQPPEQLSFDRLRAADAEGQRMLRKVVVAVLAGFPEDTSEHVEARSRLLRPILEPRELEHLAGPLLEILAPETTGCAPVVEVLACREILVDRQFLGHDAEL